MIADIGTKPLSPQPFLALRDYQLGYSTLPQVMAQMYPNCATLSAAPKQWFVNIPDYLGKSRSVLEEQLDIYDKQYISTDRYFNSISRYPLTLSNGYINSHNYTPSYLGLR